MADVFWCQVQRQTQRLRPHFHDTYALGLIAHGLSRYHCGARSFETDPATAHLINPGEVHTAFPSTREPISYTTFHVPQDYVRMHWGGGAELVFARHVDVQPGVIAALHETAMHADPATQELAVEGMLATVLPALMGRGHASEAIGLHLPGLRRAQELLRSRRAGTTSLDELVATAHMERSHFIRQFKRHFGLPPHQMLIQLRVIEARRRLFAGESAATAALAAGFSDQSHLIRCWRAVYGLPPTRMRKVNFVQSD